MINDNKIMIINDSDISMEDYCTKHSKYTILANPGFIIIVDNLDSLSE
jgi:hypothetical protein